ncbi:MAG: sugar phosphate isomerase/epimerase [Lachnospiraceae bacterium]|nr:sugar phosphate isomerase/epimerase [Lachnospiraceae bacterium]
MSPAEQEKRCISSARHGQEVDQESCRRFRRQENCREFRNREKERTEKMKLGRIAWFEEADFQSAKEQGMEFIELDVNSRAQEFLDHLDVIRQRSQEYGMPVGAVGRWGSNRIGKEGICQDELELEYRLIEAAASLNCNVYITGCNYVEELSYYENCGLAISYFEKLIAFGAEKGVKIAVYNCRWNNFVCTPMAYTMIHGYLKDLYIKYDPSHCIYDGGDYLKEARDWGDRFLHVHLKGSLVIDGERFDDPPAGMDQTNWGAFLAILYAKGYDRCLSIEPHSANWKGELGDKGVDYTIRYFKNLIL